MVDGSGGNRALRPVKPWLLGARIARLRSHRAGWALAALLIYLALFPPLYHYAIYRAATTLCLLPILAVALVYGPVGGTLAGVLALPLNVLLLYTAGERFSNNFIPTNFWTVHALFVLAGAGVGRMSQLRARVEAELAVRRQAESELAATVARLQEALREVRTLRGLLPVCTGCKKIRNGAQEWEPFEDYIGRRSEAEFTHSLCPDCVTRLYPGLDLSTGDF